MPRKKPIRKSELDKAVYSPYIPLGIVRAVDPHTFEPTAALKLKTRYGTISIDEDGRPKNAT